MHFYSVHYSMYTDMIIYFDYLQLASLRISYAAMGYAWTPLKSVMELWTVVMELMNPMSNAMVRNINILPPSLHQ